MPEGYQIYDQQGLYFLTLQVVDRIDIFSRNTYRMIVLDSMKYCIANKGLQLYAYVIMTNHIHMIVSTAPGFNLSDAIRDFKRHTSKTIINTIQQEPESRRDWMLMLMQRAASKHKRNEHFQLWTHENHAIELHSVSFTKQKLDYIHNNPVRAGFVDRAEDWLYSSARNYANEQGLIDITFIL
jgi:REP element-mobilizing transposase RayT